MKKTKQPRNNSKTMAYCHDFSFDSLIQSRGLWWNHSGKRNLDKAECRSSRQGCHGFSHPNLILAPSTSKNHRKTICVHLHSFHEKTNCFVFFFKRFFCHQRAECGPEVCEFPMLCPKGDIDDCRAPRYYVPMSYASYAARKLPTALMK